MAALFFHYMKVSYLKKYKYKLSSSYLDARTNAIIIDGKGSEALNKLLYCKLSLKELTKLHGYNNIEHDVYNYKNVLEKLYHMFEEHLRKNPNYTFFDSKESSNKKGKSNKELVIKEIIDEILLKNGKNEFKRINDLSQGKIFEYFVLQQLCKQLEARGDSEINLYFNVRNTKGEIDKKAKENKKDTFQLDLVAIYGYQLTLISVTTSSVKNMVKQKGFEAMHRARQISGSETKFVVVSFFNKENLKELEDDFKFEVGATFNRYEVICLDDIKKMYSKSGKNIFDDIIEFIKK